VNQEMQTQEEKTKNERETLYFSSCYISKQYQEIILSVRQIEFVDQLCEREPVIALELDTPPTVIGLTVKAILAESNRRSAKDNPLLPKRLSDISQGKVFYERSDYATFQIGKYVKQDNIGKAYYDTPGYQASKATIINDFNKHYLHFLVEATDKIILATVSFNEWNPIQFSKQVPLSIENEELGVLFLGFSRLCI